MESVKLCKEKLSLRLLLTFAIFGMCLTYGILVAHIYIDTEFQVSNIEEAYGTFDWIELVGTLERARRNPLTRCP